MEIIEEKENSKQEFQNLRFGMFIHFGLYSLGREHEWHQHKHKMSHQDYKKKFMREFNPDPNGMEQWVLSAKEMGAKYIICTSKHHDGFCLWNSEYEHKIDPNYTIENTKFWKNNKKSVLDYLFDAGRKHGIRIGLYYSTIDWSWTEYPKRKFFLSSQKPHPHLNADPKLNKIYSEYYKNQVLELMDKYPDLLCLWFDGYQFKQHDIKTPFIEYLEYEDLYEKINLKNPKVLVANNSGRTSGSGIMGKTDLLLFENGAGRGEQNGAPWPRESNLPGEVCLTINRAWGYAEEDKKYKKPDDIQKLVIYNAIRNTNTLLNFGPKPDGYILEEQVKIAKKIGDLLKNYSEVIYNTRADEVYKWGGIVRNLKEDCRYLITLLEPYIEEMGLKITDLIEVIRSKSEDIIDTEDMIIFTKLQPLSIIKLKIINK